METLFAHLATRFAPSPENIAIEALGFILARSPAARAAFRALAGTGGVAMPAELAFATQAAADDLARPDIEGYGPDLKRHCVVECKFWAGLTSNQPLTYSARLSRDEPGALIFVVPSARMTALWSELSKRLRGGGYDVGPRRETQAELWHAPFGPGHSFVLTSWRAVLAAILREMETARETERLDDVRQLVGLCERMDTEAFIPFRSEELTAADIPQRYMQLGQIAYDVGDALIGDGLCDTKRLTAAGGLGYYGRYLRSRDIVFFLTFDCVAWATHKLSPLWMRFDNFSPPHVLDALRRGVALSGHTPAIIEKDRRIILPIFLSPGLERPEIVREAADQVASVLADLATVAPPPAIVVGAEAE
ncbi:hypothetical protein GGQ99_003161 [Aminobacter niigataensis]|uniref:Restriction endonuclease n=1 Tax=Aminobacter niigataensis TaxID=83265 RepID=A0ABR6L3L3_9HYPH|nr:hypothetical protein [Aminobacter niigataensis]MBB4651394.1 hypothetical protein [Aminobacter niigataensis]